LTCYCHFLDKVISTFRNIAIVLVSASVFGDEVTAVEGVGYAIATAGMVLYNYTKMSPEGGAAALSSEISKVFTFATTGQHVDVDAADKAGHSYANVEDNAEEVVV
jgi:hypothetical protein